MIETARHGDSITEKEILKNKEDIIGTKNQQTFQEDHLLRGVQSNIIRVITVSILLRYCDDKGEDTDDEWRNNFNIKTRDDDGD